VFVVPLIIFGYIVDLKKFRTFNSGNNPIFLIDQAWSDSIAVEYICMEMDCCAVMSLQFLIGTS
jgi:hypothetical protein